ncbi:TetR/AcrR family transcriptional regulator [Herbidospora daliensis]|uniref:TetR/AcrR family transcriptional regulator n=1 Tax=Herbidospora daliensis TaxID=295585 RepID=UPI000B2A4496|nr:TetR/AcrR family transcriptional regulator [Herbidospora daliensis]
MADPPSRADAIRNRARILAAAAEVFDTHGTSASTEEVARTAGVAVGTVFRHFPTKADLLTALMKDLRERLAARAAVLAEEGDGTALFTFFAEVVEYAAGARTVVHLLAADIGVDRQVAALGMEVLLARAEEAGTVRAGVRADEVTALLAAACHGALSGGWTPDLRRRTVARLLDGLRP